MWLNRMAIFIAVCLSVAAGGISVYGLASIFSGAFGYVIVVASILELAKVITTTWLHKNWNFISRWLKAYFCMAILLLMIITTLGIYGFFSRAHIEQQISLSTGEISRIPLIESKISQSKEKKTEVDRQLSLINDSLSNIVNEKTGRVKNAKTALSESRKQETRKKELISQRDQINEDILKLETEKNKLQNVLKKQEVEVGPLKYVANLYYGDANTAQLENAVRILILVIVIVFDPLALALLIASVHRTVPIKIPVPKSFDIDEGIARQKRAYNKRKNSLDLSNVSIK